MKVAALRTLLPPVPGSIGSPRTPAHGPLTGWVFTLSIDRPVPSCTSTSPFPTLPSLPPTAACGHRRMPLLGFPKIAPPSFAAEESTPAAIAHHSRHALAASRRAEPLPVLVPPSRFSTALTAYASSTLHVCCTVLPTMGFLMFRSLFSLSPPDGPALRSFLPVPGCPLLAFARSRRMCRHHLVSEVFTEHLAFPLFT